MVVPSIVPRPRRLETRPEPHAQEVALPQRPRIAVDPALEGAWPLLQNVLGARLGLLLIPVANTSAGDAGDADVVVVLEPDLPPEGYRLDVSTGVRIAAADERGAIHAVRTLAQLAGPRAFRAAPMITTTTTPVLLPAVTVEDSPRLEHRGVLLDVARHFMPKDQVMRFIDLASAHKLNVLHFHLTDDQGWRLPVPGYPRLAEVASWRRSSPVDARPDAAPDATPHGGWYTSDDLREIVAFARSRGVTVVPEVDLPGHVQSLLAAYPELAPGGGEAGEVWTKWGLNPHVLGTHEAALAFATAALDQLVAIFDSPIVCIGGDEVDTRDWAADPATRDQAAELGLADVSALLPWFSARLAEHLAGHGRRASVWDEVSDRNLPKDVIINVWRTAGSAAAAIAAGHDVVQCPESELYLDHRAALEDTEPLAVGGLHTIEDVYRYEPASPEVLAAAAEPGAGRLLGAQAQVWREFLPDERRTDYATYPRLAAAAENFWSTERDWADFSARLPAHLERLDAAGVEYRPLAGPAPWQQRPALRGKAVGEP